MTDCLLLALALFVSSCATVKRPPPAASAPPAVSAPPASRRTINHIVAPGETLWRIGKMYNVPVAAIMQRNGLSNRSGLKYGQKLVIPDAAPLQPVISLYPSHKWKYIILHHSGTEEGSSLQFHKYHLGKGWDQGVGYHFVIDNGKSGKQDGQIETTPRWLKQQDGAHCKAGNMNVKAIGICLVGDFNREKLSSSQMESLLYLVDKLRRYYNIPASHILGHRDVPGSRTDCPGRLFPWSRFKASF